MWEIKVGDVVKFNDQSSFPDVVGEVIVFDRDNDSWCKVLYSPRVQFGLSNSVERLKKNSFFEDTDFSDIKGDTMIVCSAFKEDYELLSPIKKTKLSEKLYPESKRYKEDEEYMWVK